MVEVQTDSPPIVRLEGLRMSFGANEVLKGIDLEVPATTGSAEERLGFALSWILAARDRPFKLRTYPSIVFCLLFPVIMLSQTDRGLAGVTDRMLQPGGYLLGLYATALLLPMVLSQIGFSAEFEAGWIYHALPVAVPGRVLRGSTQTVLLRFGLLPFGLAAGVLLALLGWEPARPTRTPSRKLGRGHASRANPGEGRLSPPLARLGAEDAVGLAQQQLDEGAEPGEHLGRAVERQRLDFVREPT